MKKLLTLMFAMAMPLTATVATNTAQAANTTTVTASAARTPITTAAQARATLKTVPVDLTNDFNKYDRTGQFGSAWIDIDANRCDTRNDILKRDLKNITRAADNCTVLKGTLYDPYNRGKVISFVRGVKTSSAVQIDHITPLGYAITAGADKWTFAERKAFANDPENLLAVDGPTNGSKSAKGPSQWNVPGNTAYRCTYAIKWTNVMDKYKKSSTRPTGLQLKAADKAVLTAVLATCK